MSSAAHFCPRGEKMQETMIHLAPPSHFKRKLAVSMTFFGQTFTKRHLVFLSSWLASSFLAGRYSILFFCWGKSPIGGINNNQKPCSPSKTKKTSSLQPDVFLLLEASDVASWVVVSHTKPGGETRFVRRW